MFKRIGSRSNALKKVTLLFLLLSGTLSIFKAYCLFIIFRKTAYLYHGHIFFRGFLKFYFLPHTHPPGQTWGRKMYRLVCTSTLVKSRNRLRCLPLSATSPSTLCVFCPAHTSFLLAGSNYPYGHCHLLHMAISTCKLLDARLSASHANSQKAKVFVHSGLDVGFRQESCPWELALPMSRI